MASQDRPDPALERARRVGQRLVARLDLRPPVDIEAVVDQYANIEYDEIPADCDAVVVGLDTARPTVILHRYQPPRRLRFSLGHELGHILVPGHIGIEVCHTASAYYYAISEKEREAHTFASEVLVPTRWLEEVVAGTNSIGEVLSEVDSANVSAAAGCLAVIRALPPGSVLALMDGAVVEMALASQHTYVNLPRENRDLDARQLDGFSSERGAVTLSGRSIRWWSFPPTVELPPESEERTASEILRHILSDVYPDGGAQRDAFSSISAISGHAKGAYGFSSAEELHATLRARFTERREHMAVTGHAQFETYLAKRARELAGGS